MEKLANCFMFCMAFLYMLCISSCFDEKPGTSNIDTDRSALLSLKSKITFEPYNMIANNWSTTSYICNWIGVSCGTRHERVVALDLSHMGLQGTIPPNIGNLSFLVSFDISNNSFHGHLPQELARLRRLKEIYFSNNQFNGGLPTWFGVLPKVQVLLLANNSFTGTIPTSLFNISMLQRLNIRFNSLQGSIPREIGDLQNLEWLAMDGNQLSGGIPPRLCECSKLEELWLSRNSFTGTIPGEIGKLQNLGTIVLDDNPLNGSIPATMFNISTLRIVSFTNNSLSGNLPTDMFNHAPRLQELYMSANMFTGPIPMSLYDLSKLEILSLSFNNFTGPIAREIGNLTSLQSLWLGHNNLTGEIPWEIGNLHNLKLLRIENANLAGTIPEAIGSLYKLEDLYLNSNNLEGSIPKTIFNLSALIAFSAFDNHLSGTLPPFQPSLQGLNLAWNELNKILPGSLSNSSQLISLELSQNKFTGPVPNFLGSLGELEYLNLQNNSFTNELSKAELSFFTSLTSCRKLRNLYMSYNPLGATIPASIGNLSNSIELIELSDCRIKGRIPNEVGNLSSLMSLFLIGNELSGFIPTTLKGLWKLQELSINDNVIGGSIPNEICLLHKNLGQLDLSQNQISGPVPTCFGNLTSIRYLYLSSNRLTSNVPRSMWNLKDLLELDISSNFLSGQLAPEISSLKVLVQLNISYNQFSGDIPGTIGDLQRLTYLSLAYNGLQGLIPETLRGLLSLEYLDLSHNKLSGQIPKSLEGLKYLSYFNVSFNSLTGEIPSGGPFANFTSQSFFSNELCGAPRLHVLPCKNNSHHHATSRSVIKWVLFPLITSIILVLAFVFVLVRYQKSRRMPTQIDFDPIISRERVSYHELMEATEGFAESKLLGYGSFGSVYKGVLSDGMNVAIKVFKLPLERASKSFETECEIIRNIRHRNLTKVITSCSNLDFRALILEYMPNGSLEKWLYSHNLFLDFLQRLNTMIDVACALDYLHHGYATPVVHCDLKPSNVLLDDDMVGHVSDFGIAKILSEVDPTAHTETLGTIGYLAPEYGLEGSISTHSDVYSFGIMLIETFTGKRPTDEMFSGEMSLKSWVNESIPNALIQVVDVKLLREDEKDYSVKMQCVTSIMELAMHCSAESPDQRKNMSEILATLTKIRSKLASNRNAGKER